MLSYLALWASIPFPAATFPDPIPAPAPCPTPAWPGHQRAPYSATPLPAPSPVPPAAPAVVPPAQWPRPGAPRPFPCYWPLWFSTFPPECGQFVVWPRRWCQRGGALRGAGAGRLEWSDGRSAPWTTREKTAKISTSVGSLTALLTPVHEKIKPHSFSLHWTNFRQTSYPVQPTKPNSKKFRKKLKNFFLKKSFVHCWYTAKKTSLDNFWVQKVSKFLWIFFLTEWAMKVQSILFGSAGARATNSAGKKTRQKRPGVPTATWTRLTSSSRMNSATNFWGFVGGLEKPQYDRWGTFFPHHWLDTSKEKKKNAEKLPCEIVQCLPRFFGFFHRVILQKRGKNHAVVEEWQGWRWKKTHGNNALRLDVINPKMVGIVDDGARLLQQLLQQWQLWMGAPNAAHGASGLRCCEPAAEWCFFRAEPRWKAGRCLWPLEKKQTGKNHKSHLLSRRKKLPYTTGRSEPFSAAAPWFPSRNPPMECRISRCVPSARPPSCRHWC